jgi:hypothetical protein
MGYKKRTISIIFSKAYFLKYRREKLIAGDNYWMHIDPMTTYDH